MGDIMEHALPEDLTGRILLTPAEAARVLRISVHTARAWGRSGRLRNVNPGGRPRFLASEVLEIAPGEMDPTPPSSPEDRDCDIRDLIGRARAIVAEEEVEKAAKLREARSKAVKGKRRSPWYRKKGFRMVKP